MSDEVIVFPDVVATARTFLAAELAARSETAHVGSRSSTGRSVTIRLVGAEQVNVVVERSTIAVDVSVGDGPTAQEDAHDLAQLCRALLRSMAGTAQPNGTVYKVVDVTLANEPDALTGEEGHTFHQTISMRGHALV